jgi:V8-like Glu-specific endopeptidase
MSIDRVSVQSLFIEMYFNDTRLSSGTGFVVQEARSLVLITNRHNVTGRRQDNNQPLSDTGGIPNSIRVWRNAAGNTGGWRAVDYSLYDNDENPQWIEHPTMGPTADFVALPVDTPFDVVNYSYVTSAPEQQLLIRPAETVSVVGFPFGQAAGGLFGVWVSGFVASEPDVNFNGLPQFLVDCRTRPGQSGSPVIAVRRGSATYKNGSTVIGPINIVELLGIYSGRINDKSDIGIVWKREAIDELVQSITPAA